MTLRIAGCAQKGVDPYSTGATLFSGAGCPVFVGGIAAGSPAERAGIQAGDQIVAVGGTPIKDLRQATRLLGSERPTAAAVRLARNGTEFEAVLDRERESAILRRDGKKITSGVIVPLDTTQAEVDRMLNFDGHRYVDRVFPTHYPQKPELFYVGFEIFILRNPTQVTVGGIEDGPGAKAGVHWGDALISINGTPTFGKTRTELELLFSAKAPVPVHLQIERIGSMKAVDFHMEKAEWIAQQNSKRFVDGQLVPLWASDQYLHCFLK